MAATHAADAAGGAIAGIGRTLCAGLEQPQLDWQAEPEIEGPDRAGERRHLQPSLQDGQQEGLGRNPDSAVAAAGAMSIAQISHAAARRNIHAPRSV